MTGWARMVVGFGAFVLLAIVCWVLASRGRRAIRNDLAYQRRLAEISGMDRHQGERFYTDWENNHGRVT